MKTVNGASLYAPAVYGPAGRILCTVYTAEGNGPHPVLIFTHGYPGHEKNLDLAQSLRRTGFSSVIFFYRGCWGTVSVAVTCWKPIHTMYILQEKEN